MEVITIESQAYKQLISELTSIMKYVTSMPQNSTTELKIYTSDELGKLLSVTPRYLQNCRNKGFLSYSKIGRRIIYTQEHVDEFIKNNEHTAYRFKR